MWCLVEFGHPHMVELPVDAFPTAKGSSVARSTGISKVQQSTSKMLDSQNTNLTRQKVVEFGDVLCGRGRSQESSVLQLVEGEASNTQNNKTMTKGEC